MSVYIDPWGDQQSRATVTVLEESRSAKVTFKSETGKRFAVMVHQRPNPIGFHARLPGDAPKRKP
jgi:hypothetical protein